MTFPFWGAYTAAHAAHHESVQRLNRAQSRARRRRGRERAQVKEQIDDLRADLEFVTLTLATLLTELDSRGSVTREDLREIMRAVDEYDGELDARLPVSALQELLRPPTPEEAGGDGAG